VGIGRNYAEHAKELGNEVPKVPFFFLKPTSSYISSGRPIEIPRGVIVHHEVELGVIIGSKARDVPASRAMDYIGGYCVALDLTARNMQDVVMKAGLPWSAVKGFDTFCPISKFVPREAVKNPHNLELQLKINNSFRQKGPTSEMIFGIPQIIEYTSSIMTLEEGDLLLTGTPSGVGPVEVGDKLEAQLLQGNEELARWEGEARQRSGGFAFTS